MKQELDRVLEEVRSASTRSGWSRPTKVPLSPREMDISSKEWFSV